MPAVPKQSTQTSPLLKQLSDGAHRLVNNYVYMYGCEGRAKFSAHGVGEQSLVNVIFTAAYYGCNLHRLSAIAPISDHLSIMFVAHFIVL